MGLETHSIPKYVIFADPVNPGIVELERARTMGDCVRFAVMITGIPSQQFIDFVPTVVQCAQPNGSYCLLRGRICEPGGQSNRLIEGMYHLASRGYGGFDDA